jgi:hypothetical protein
MKTKTILWVLGIVALIGGSYYVYNNYEKHGKLFGK